MEKKIIWIVIILVIVIGGAVSYYFLTRPEVKVGSSVEQCNWVYKVEENYSNLIGIILTKNKTEISPECPFLESKKLVQDYYAAEGCLRFEDRMKLKCFYSNDMDLVFTSITLEEWIQSIKEFEECRERTETKDKFEELFEEPECKPKYLPENLLNYIIDYNPITELYLCKVPSDEINSIINNNELSSKCEKII